MKNKLLPVISMVFCSKCGFKNNDDNNNCENCGELLIKKEHFEVKSYENFEDIFTKENYEKLDEITLEGYNTVIENIINMGHHHLEEYYKNTEVNKRHMNILDKIKSIAEAYSKISYKSSGAELGSYSFNIIRVDDRLDKASQISTLIHELSHHLFSEIFEQLLMYVWGSAKSDAIEALAWFTLIGSPLTQLTNEYCAHTCEGRFVPHGYQNYGSFNNILMQEFDPEKDQKSVTIGLVMGNTIAQDILQILEEFIDYDLREEIKLQFKKDFTYPPKYDQIMLETNAILSPEDKIASIISITKSGYDAAKDKKMREILDTFKNNYTEINED